MTKIENPSKEAVRLWLRREVKSHQPPPDPADIRRELGWGLTETSRVTDAARNA